MDKILTLEDAAAELKMTERYLSDQIKAGKLAAKKVGKRIYVLYSDLIEFIKSGKEATSEKDK